MGSKGHTAINKPRRRDSAYLSGSNASVNLRCPPVGYAQRNTPPCRSVRVYLEDRPPQQIARQCDSCTIVPIMSCSCTIPRFTGVRPVIGVGPKSHTTISVPSEEARTCLLIRQPLIRELAEPPPPDGV
ncbi:hypothetical protein AVEN_127010-1 [Araneus ventricosus]|uniref:Uncharacterized protein n=1 Tax=Araneus ventricosus TaxID=182803 RepID=A0A4Y2C099_ARAVE|nr:hypothetical protein AVEN_127010-1 [Araneus ventricosus]